MGWSILAFGGSQCSPGAQLMHATLFHPLPRDVKLSLPLAMSLRVALLADLAMALVCDGAGDFDGALTSWLL